VENLSEEKLIQTPEMFYVCYSIDHRCPLYKCLQAATWGSPLPFSAFIVSTEELIIYLIRVLLSCQVIVSFQVVLYKVVITITL